MELTIIASILSLIVGIFVNRYGFFSNRVHKLEVMVATVKAAKSERENKIANYASEKMELQKQITDRENENSELKLKLAKYENKKAIFAKHTEHQSGYYVHNETKKEFCPECMHDDPLKESPLTKTKNDFTCKRRNCDYSYRHTPLEPPNFGKSAWEKIDS